MEAVCLIPTGEINPAALHSAQYSGHPCGTPQLAANGGLRHLRVRARVQAAQTHQMKERRLSVWRRFDPSAWQWLSTARVER